MRNEPNPNIIQSIVRATAVLESMNEGLSRVTDISNEINLGKTTVHKLLKTLEALGYVVQDPVTHHYYLGGLLVRLSSNPIISHQRLILYAFDEMKYIRDLTGETVALQVKLGVKRIFIEELPSTHNIRFTLGKGSVAPLHIGGGGRVLLSQLSQRELEQYLNRIKLVNEATNEIIDKEELKNKVKRIKQEGYDTSYDETALGGAGISVPIKNYTYPAAISIFGPKERFKEKMMFFLPEIMERADCISKKLLEAP